jgi:hypothetical protein
MNDGSIVYEVRVSSDNVGGDLEKAGALLERGTRMLTQLAANTAQIFGKMMGDMFGNSVSFAESSITRLGAGFERLRSMSAPLLNALRPISNELERISRLSLASVGEAAGRTVTHYTRNNTTNNNSVNPLSLIPKFSTGASYIPYDDFPALLHKGEAVLTASENAALKAAGGVGALSQNAPVNTQNNANISDDISRRPVEVTLKIGEYEFTQIIADTMNNLYRQWGEKPLK